MRRSSQVPLRPWQCEQVKMPDPEAYEAATTAAAERGPCAEAEADEEEWTRPSPRLLRLRWVEVGVAGVVAVAALVVLGAAANSVVAYAFGAAAAVATLALLPFERRRYRSWGYAEREDDLLVRRGVAFARLSVIPYGRMQFIDVTAGPLERMFGLATVRLHTAAAATDARIPGLEREEAARLRDRLAELGEAQAAGL
jgi:membrane protein YdbS with pleckstrin-like domain